MIDYVERNCNMSPNLKDYRNFIHMKAKNPDIRGKVWKFPKFLNFAYIWITWRNGNQIWNVVISLRRVHKIRKLRMSVFSTIHILQYLEPNFTKLLNLWCSIQLWWELPYSKISLKGPFKLWKNPEKKYTFLVTGANAKTFYS